MSDEKAGPVPGEDALDRALRELTDGSAGEARFREPSAAERDATARKLSRQAARQVKSAKKAARVGTRKRAKAAAKPADNPADGWRGGYRYDVPAAEARRRRAGRRVVRGVAWTMSIALLGGAVWYAHSRGVFGRGAASADGTRPVTGGAVPSASLSAGGPPADPFAGTPADSWANGAAGIVTPAATAHGTYSAAQVAHAFAVTRQMLIAQNLDPVTLAGGTPTAFANLLIPLQRNELIAGLHKAGVDKQGYPLSTRGWVTSFAPGTTTFIGKDIKVHGTMTADVITNSDGQPEFHISVNYRFVYAVEPPGNPAAWRRVVAQVTGYVGFGNWPTGTTSFVPWNDLAGSVAGSRCDAHDGYVHPYYSTDPIDTTPEKGEVDPYSTATPAAASETPCSASSQT